MQLSGELPWCLSPSSPLTPIQAAFWGDFQHILASCCQEGRERQLGRTDIPSEPTFGLQLETDSSRRRKITKAQEATKHSFTCKHQTLQEGNREGCVALSTHRC